MDETIKSNYSNSHWEQLFCSPLNRCRQFAESLHKEKNIPLGIENDLRTLDFGGKEITTIDLLRHGECEGGNIFRGSSDVQLTKAGWETMQAVIDTHNADKYWEELITSPLQRCRKFSESLNELYNIPLSIENNFRELDFGDWEGMETQHIWDTQREKIEILYSNPVKFSPPNGEAMQAFEKRVILTWENTLQKFRGKHLLLIQHGGTIRVLLIHLLSAPLKSMSRFSVPYGCFIRFKIFHDTETTQPVMIFYKEPTA